MTKTWSQSSTRTHSCILMMPITQIQQGSNFLLTNKSSKHDFSKGLKEPVYSEAWDDQPWPVKDTFHWVGTHFCGQKFSLRSHFPKWTNMNFLSYMKDTSRPTSKEIGLSHRLALKDGLELYIETRGRKHYSPIMLSRVHLSLVC